MTTEPWSVRGHSIYTATTDPGLANV